MPEDKRKILSAIAKIKTRLTKLDTERRQLTEDLHRLNIKLEECRLQSTAPSPSVTISSKSANRQKISLFRSLFRGREDVYPRLWISKKSGKQGYSPVCENEWTQVIIKDEKRNRMIVDDVIKVLKERRSPIILTERKEHLELLQDYVRHLVVLHGGMKASVRKEMIARVTGISDNEERLILATGSYIGEGFDDPRLDTLFLTMPISFKGKIVQYTGRFHRLYKGKTEIRIYDYCDNYVPVLQRMYDRRLKAYKALGYSDPSSTVKNK